MEPTTKITLAPDAIPSALAQYSVTEDVLSGIRQYAKFQIIDKPSYDTAAKAAGRIKKLRIGIEAKRKELKQPALDFGKAVDDEAKRLTALIQPVENHLLAEVKRVDDEEAARKAQLHRQRTLELNNAGFMFDGRFWMAGLFSIEAAKLAELSDDEYAATLEDGRKYVEGERKRKEAEEQRRREEEARIEQQRRELEAQKAEMAAKLAEYEQMKAAQEARQAGVEQMRAGAPASSQPTVTPDPFFDPAPRPVVQHPQPNPFEQINTVKHHQALAPFDLGYNKGVADCIAILEQPEKRTRAEFVALMKELMR